MIVFCNCILLSSDGRLIERLCTNEIDLIMIRFNDFIAYLHFCILHLHESVLLVK